MLRLLLGFPERLEAIEVNSFSLHLRLESDLVSGFGVVLMEIAQFVWDTIGVHRIRTVELVLSA